MAYMQSQASANKLRMFPLIPQDPAAAQKLRRLATYSSHRHLIIGSVLCPHKAHTRPSAPLSKYLAIPAPDTVSYALYPQGQPRHPNPSSPTRPVSGSLSFSSSGEPASTAPSQPMGDARVFV